MAAGQGFKTFTTGEVLTAGDVNGYLMQGINVFATTTARDAAITAPAEGQFAFTKDTNSLWYYDGAAWVASGATGDIEGVTAGVGISGGGTSGTVTITNDMATTITASGDIVVGTGSGTYDNLPIGTTGQVLTADTSVSPYKVKWATSGGAGLNWTLLNTGGTALTGAATITVSGISNKEYLLITVIGASTGATQDDFRIRINGDTTSKYTNAGLSISTALAYDANNFDRVGATTTFIQFAQLTTNATSTASGYVKIDGGTSTGIKTYQGVGASNAPSASYNGQAFVIGGHYAATAAITSISITNGNAVNFDAGTIYVYGA
jgi:hypothetical protein